MVNVIDPKSEKYNGKVTAVGNSKGIRIDAAFFKAHPEFNGDVKATVLADGQVLLSAKPTIAKGTTAEDADPVMLGFLSFLDKQLLENPELVTPVDQAQLIRIGLLVEGVIANDAKR
jgi:hypothetical protein